MLERCFWVYMWMQESKYIFVFSDLISAENKKCKQKCWKGVSYD
jgi:hypothetical protein